MSGSEAISGTIVAAPPRNRWLRLAIRAAEAMRAGQLTLVLPDGAAHRVVRGETPAASIVLRDLRAVKKLILGGALGLSEAYLEGWWESPDIRAVMELAARNEQEWLAMLNGRPLTRALARVAHRLRPNTRRGAARNIVEHYDLGNDFYAAWLDPTMTYSSALFANGGENLEAAQQRKIRRLLDGLALKPGMRLLEIGCGWGALAEIAARDYGASVTGITLSPSQLALGRERIGRAGLGERVSLQLCDYRDVRGTFDAIASVEMFEAVGEEYWPAFFRAVRERVAPGGRAHLQVITIADHLFENYRRGADFIQRHVFPGGMLPCPARLREEAAKAGLAWRDAFWFGRDYADTLARWNEAFQAAWPRLASARRDARFKRLWEYYLAYCETGFRAGWTDVGQILLAG
jgi:cyclopropane-fatty-acyl-phospholipid synthase